MRRHVPTALSLFIAFVFIQSLFFKFSNAPETQHIFGTLDAWAGTLGLAGLFAPSGLFSQYVVGSAELIAASLLLLGMVLPGKAWLQGLGALMAIGVISGAIFFHLFTPLGVEVQGDGGLLFGMACGVWLSGAIVAWLRKDALLKLIGRGD